MPSHLSACGVSETLSRWSRGWTLFQQFEGGVGLSAMMVIFAIIAVVVGSVLIGYSLGRRAFKRKHLARDLCIAQA
jgi:hypothetical protein